MRSPISSEAARPIGVILVLLSAAVFAYSGQPKDRTPAEVPPQGLVAQVQQLNQIVQELRAEVAARKIAWYDKQEQDALNRAPGASPQFQPFPVTPAGWTSPVVSLRVRKGDLIRVFVDFVARPVDNGFYWQVRVEGKASSNSPTPGRRLVIPDFAGNAGWQSQSTIALFRADDDDDEVKFGIAADQGDRAGKGDIESLVIVAENLGKR